MTNELHWIMTVQWQTTYGGTVLKTREGLFTPTSKHDRQDVYYHLLDEVEQELDIPVEANVVVLFFALEPNVL